MCEIAVLGSLGGREAQDVYSHTTPRHTQVGKDMR